MVSEDGLEGSDLYVPRSVGSLWEQAWQPDDGGPLGLAVHGEQGCSREMFGPEHLPDLGLGAEQGVTVTLPTASPRTRDLGGSYYLNLTSHFHWSALEVSVGLYTSLCQYFSEKDMMWKTEGLVPLEETSPSQAVCLTRHLTAFGASLFVPPSHVHFIFPVSNATFLSGGETPETVR